MLLDSLICCLLLSLFPSPLTCTLSLPLLSLLMGLLSLFSPDSFLEPEGHAVPSSYIPSCLCASTIQIPPNCGIKQFNFVHHKLGQQDEDLKYHMLPRDIPACFANEMKEYNLSFEYLESTQKQNTAQKKEQHLLEILLISNIYGISGRRYSQMGQQDAL